MRLKLSNCNTSSMIRKRSQKINGGGFSAFIVLNKNLFSNITRPLLGP